MSVEENSTFSKGTRLTFDGKRLRKSLYRKTIDYNSSTLAYVLNRTLPKYPCRKKQPIEPHELYSFQTQKPSPAVSTAVSVTCTRFVKQATNKKRCPIYTVLWTPDGKRLTTGSASGEFTLWNGLVFNFETILQAHDEAIQAMVWSHNDNWLVSGDSLGFLKYWQPNMNNVKMFQAHKEPVRSLSFSPSDQKFASSSNDGTLRVWDFISCREEHIFREHGADVSAVDWHPRMGLLASGSRDSQRPVKLWDPRTDSSLRTLHVHKSAVTDVRWNSDGNRLLTASEDRTIKLFDSRQFSRPVQIFAGHRKEVSVLSWHPVFTDMFASGGNDGSIFYWSVGTEKEIGVVQDAHDSTVWSLSWHPLGHLLVSGSNDHSIKFWTRYQPGDQSQLDFVTNPNREEDCEQDVLTLLNETHNYNGNIPGLGEAVDIPRRPVPIYTRPARMPPTPYGLAFGHFRQDYSPGFCTSCVVVSVR